MDNCQHILYLPGLGYEFNNASVKTYAGRFMKALDEQHPNASLRFLLKSEEETLASGDTVTVVSVLEDNGQQQQERYRFYEFRYAPWLTAQWQQSSPLRQYLSLSFTLLGRLPLALRSLLGYAAHAPLTARLQGAYFLVLFFMMSLVLFLLAPAALLAATELLAGYFPQLKEWLSGQLQWADQLSHWAQGLLVIFTGLALVKGDTTSVVKTLTGEMMSAHHYLSFAQQRLVIQGRLSALLEHIAETRNQAVAIHAYSFGSIIALDNLFPHQGPVPVRVCQTVRHLVTIGCPLDFINTYWPHYLNRSPKTPLPLESWTNIHSPLDVLSSQLFRPGQNLPFALAPQTHCEDLCYRLMANEQLGPWQILTLVGLKSHGGYWDPDPQAGSCLQLLTPRLLPGE
ncbi:hypothetical protein [Gallaecimonas pentaromativorans]|uniref:Uncharacterized protein n=1 Tax=Gallaecimonas pentaromativorans TaxID=584787 RepID=A0A3N1PF64_9GAMM|nr:hypothetical protein [Gallaecimonas pentaromativorans]ROQ30092.1 hypothetical protein EDC28_102485 [Gallaecimonas pentaromativorans]